MRRGAPLSNHCGCCRLASKRAGKPGKRFREPRGRSGLVPGLPAAAAVRLTARGRCPAFSRGRPSRERPQSEVRRGRWLLGRARPARSLISSRCAWARPFQEPATRAGAIRRKAGIVAPWHKSLWPRGQASATGSGAQGGSHPALCTAPHPLATHRRPRSPRLAHHHEPQLGHVLDRVAHAFAPEARVLHAAIRHVIDSK